MSFLSIVKRKKYKSIIPAIILIFRNLSQSHINIQLCQTWNGPFILVKVLSKLTEIKYGCILSCHYHNIFRKVCKQISLIQNIDSINKFLNKIQITDKNDHYTKLQNNTLKVHTTEYLSKNSFEYNKKSNNNKKLLINTEHY